MIQFIPALRGNIPKTVRPTQQRRCTRGIIEWIDCKAVAFWSTMKAKTWKNVMKNSIAVSIEYSQVLCISAQTIRMLQEISAFCLLFSFRIIAEKLYPSQVSNEEILACKRIFLCYIVQSLKTYNHDSKYVFFRTFIFKQNSTQSSFLSGWQLVFFLLD